MAAPIIGSGYMAVAPTPPNPPNQNEQVDPAFQPIWNALKYRLPADWQGDNSLIKAVQDISLGFGLSVVGPTVTPAITSLSPTGVTNGAAAFTLTINGTRFSFNATATFGGATKPVTYISPTQLSIPIAAADVAAAGAKPVVVTNGNGQASNSVNFTVS